MVVWLQNNGGYGRWGPTESRVDALLESFRPVRDKERDKSFVAVPPQTPEDANVVASSTTAAAETNAANNTTTNSSSNTTQNNNDLSSTTTVASNVDTIAKAAIVPASV